MSRDTSDSSAAECERLFAELLEQHHENDLDPELFFAGHPEHGATLRRWWQRLADAGEVRLSGRDRFGPFVLLQQIGAGAQGQVHLAEDTRLDRNVALKILPTHRALRSGAVRRFEREAKVAARLEHPGICAVYESGEVDGAAYIAMQHLDGRTLAALLADARRDDVRLPADRVLRWCEQIAAALHAAHREGLVHRDVKPGNVMITADDQPVLMDFGLVHDSEEDSDLTRTGDVIGTPAYMAPEQLHGGRYQVDARADVYSLGVILFEALTLRRPFEAPTQEQLHRQILSAPLPDVAALRPDLGSDFGVVARTALARDRLHRYESADALAEDLRRLRVGEPVSARPPGAWQLLMACCRRSPALAASLALLFATLVTGAVVSLALYLEARAARLRYDQLADLERLRQARVAAQALDADASSLGRWLVDHGEPLAASLPDHRRALRELRARAVAIETGDELSVHTRQRIADLEARRENSERALVSPRNPINRELHTFAVEGLAVAIDTLRQSQPPGRPRFASAEDAFVHRELTQLVDELERFVAAGGALEEVRDRLEWARRVHGETIATRQALWQRVDRELAADPRFAGLRLQPQLGLVPVGRDPRTGLQEFAFARGGQVPQRDPVDDQLVLTPADAPVFVLIPPGAFVAGSSSDPAHPSYDVRAKESEMPPIDVELDWFFLGKHELSRAQWQRLGGSSDSYAMTAATLGDDLAMHPITEISWHDASALLARHGLLLPTELQWEYAARAGTRTPYLTGRQPRRMIPFGNFRSADPGGGADGYRYTAPIDTMACNAFGLWHVCGNAAEWCREPFMNPAYSRAERRPGDAEMRVAPAFQHSVRGASFTAAAQYGRTAARAFRAAHIGYFAVGLRPARAVQHAR